MTKRKAIPKRTRFEVFKRDSFTCQYCGRKAPDVVLNIDHINPVSRGGDNDIMNLVTACHGCNAGKSDVPLSDGAAVEARRRQLDALQARRDQLEMMMEWQAGLSELEGDEASVLCELWSQLVPGWLLNEHGRRDVIKLLGKHSVSDVADAMRLATTKYVEIGDDGKATHGSMEVTFRKLSGVLHVNRQAKTRPYINDLYYIRGILRNRLGSRDSTYRECMRLLEKAHLAGSTIRALKSHAAVVDCWDRWWLDIDDATKTGDDGVLA